MASSTTNDNEIARNPHPSKGLGRDGTISLLLLLADVWTSTRRRASIWSPSRSQHTSSYLWTGVLSAAKPSQLRCQMPEQFLPHHTVSFLGQVYEVE